MDKKAIAILGAFMAVVGIGVLFAFMFFQKPPSAHESAAATGGEFHFPVSQRPANAPPEPPETGGEEPEGAPGAAGNSSLAFLQKDKNITGAQGGAGGFSGAGDDAAKAAAKGDAAGMMDELRKGGSAGGGVPDVEGGGKKMSASTVRDLMQGVVDTVHKLQPKWYKEYLSNKSLKAIADRYDQTQDFKGFVKSLAKSSPFHAMMKAYSKTAGMKSLVKTLLGDKTMGSQLRQLFLQNASDQNMLGLVAAYGKDSGMPSDLVEHAEGLAQGGAAPEEPQPAAAPARRAPPPARLPNPTGGRPRLKSMGFGGNAAGSGFGGRQAQGGQAAQGGQGGQGGQDVNQLLQQQGLSSDQIQQAQKYLQKRQ